MDLLKGVVGKVVAGAVTLAVIAGGITWWQMDPAARHSLLASTGRILGWTGFVLVIPWATFFVIGWVAKMDTNLSGGLLVAAYTLVESLLLAWLFNWHVAGAAGFTGFGLGVLISAAYNLFTCDWIAEKVA